MTDPAGFDRTLTAWLDDAGAQDVPPRVIDAAIHEARHTRRSRPLPYLITRLIPMSTNFVAAPPLPLNRHRPLARLGPVGVFIALALLFLALVGAALLSVGGRQSAAVLPSPSAPVRNGLIAYDSGGDIWVADSANDYKTRQLTFTPAQETNPAWSPDGTRIAYWSVTGATSVVGIIDDQGRVIKEISRPGGLDLGQGSELHWSPDGGTLLVISTGTDPSSLVAIDVETGTGKVFPNGVGLPVWSRDGSRIAWGGVNDSPAAVQIANADGSGITTVSPAGRPAGWPSFTPAADGLVYNQQSEAGVDGDIVGSHLDGTGWHTIVGGATNDVTPALSPNGASVAFLRSTAPSIVGLAGSHTADVYVAGIDGTGLQQVGSALGDWGSLSWAPDGTHVATFNLGSDHIVVMALDDTVAPVEIPTPNNVGNFSWQAIR